MQHSKWQRAARFAAKAHGHEKRDDGQTPYFAHPARVALTVSQTFGCEDENALAAAFLHDTIEDTPTEYDDIKEHFGRDVADLVAALTKNQILPQKEREQDAEERLGKADWRARLVKMADEYDNYLACLEGEKKTLDGEERKKCKIAMELARPDAKEHKETRRALEALKDLLKQRPEE